MSLLQFFLSADIYNRLFIQNTELTVHPMVMMYFLLDIQYKDKEEEQRVSISLRTCSLSKGSW